MGIKKYNAYTPSRRHMTGRLRKSLVVSLDKNAGVTW